MRNRVNISCDGEISHVNFQDSVHCTSDGSRTLLELFLNSCEMYGDDDFLGTIVNDVVEYKSFNEIRVLVEGFSRFLNGLVPQKEVIGIHSKNRYECIVAEMATYMSKCANVSLYSTFSRSAIELILKETEMKICVVSSLGAQSLLESVVSENSGSLRHVIFMDRDIELASKFEKIGVCVHYFDDVVKTQGGNLRGGPTGEDLATICYTSGTSGIPKGVILSHRNFITSIFAFSRGSTAREILDLERADVVLSYLPLAHVMEKICMAIEIKQGAKVVFYRGEPKMIQMDCSVVKPTFIAVVPRVLNVFKEKIEEKVQEKSCVVRWIFWVAMKYKIWRQKHGIFEVPFLDKLIFNKISREFGGRIRGILCGAASLKPEVLHYLQAVLSCHIFQGYGQTEGGGANILQPLDFYEYDNVGIPFPSNKVKLGKIPGYGEDSGEILLKGNNITSGYYKRPEQTAKIFTEDGWLKTGDIGRFHDGVFSIVGRQKDIFKTSFGEYIVPEKLESLYTGGIVVDIFIVGAKYSNKVAAIVFCPDITKTIDDVRLHIESIGKKFVEKSVIVKFEIPNRFLIVRKPFESFGDFVTPTIKKRRHLIEDFFKKDIEILLRE